MRYMACFFNTINPTTVLVQAAGAEPDAKVCENATLVFYLKDTDSAAVFKDTHRVLRPIRKAYVSEAQVLEWIAKGQPKLGWNWDWNFFDNTNYYDLP